MKKNNSRRSAPKSFRVGIIGCGRVSPFHGLPAASQETVETLCCCDIRRECAEEKARLFGCEGVYTDYREMIRGENLNVVHLCLPHYLHAPVAMDAMAMGCHVLTEKPMSIGLQDARDMIDCASRHNVHLGVIFQNRYNAGSNLIKSALQHGSLGRIRAAKATLTWFRANEYYTGSDWKGTWDKEGGGVIIDQAIHTLDLLRWFVGDDLAFVEAHIANREHDAIEVEDVADGVLGFRGGVRASFWVMNYYSHDAEVEIEISCENGFARMVSEEARVVFHDGREFLARPNPEDSFDYGGGPSYWGASHVKQIDQFYEALSADEAPEIDGTEALKTQAMICAIYESGKTRKRVLL
ncbi:MAG: Gfo/Idh/MocA family oxidoreductase [Lentisphaeria bacterium]|nr:Gfo/Idh/MocA family oxidoreductase [Lentisphaeria bacterium]